MSLKWILLGLLAVAAGAHAQEQNADPANAPASREQAMQAAQKLVDSFAWKDGEVAVDGAKARIRLDENFRYLGADEAQKVLEDLWGNPPDDTVLGMVVPKGRSVLDDAGWAVVVTYSDEGYVSDEDAAKIDYTEMLKEMQAADAEINEQRKQAGYGTLEIVGWAEAPRYDAASKKLYWAKELRSEGSTQNTLNYDIRVLGRHGYLSLNAVSRMGELAEVKAGMQKLLPTVEFDAGARYADFNESSDKVAAYGLAALVGGGLAAKSGLLAKLGVLLLSLKKLLIPLLILLAAFGQRILGFFRRGKRDGEAQV